MDVAAFVGCAVCGPVDIPVPIEDLGHFRDIFGDDPQLAFDAELHQPELGYLGAAVEAFLASGGKRCWVVRVAESPDLAEFPIDGLATLQQNTNAFDADPVIAPARSAGPWAEDLRAHTTLHESPLLVGSQDANPPLQFSTDSSGLTASLRVVGSPGSVTAGDTIRVRATGSDQELFFVVATVLSLERALLLTAQEWVLARPLDESPPPDLTLRAERLEILDRSRLDQGPSSPWLGADLVADVLTFSLSAWRDDQLVGRVDDLAFSPRHPRYWGNLPDDIDLFWREVPHRADGRDEELSELRDEAAGNLNNAPSGSATRFPFAGPALATASERMWPLHLPNGMPKTSTPEPAPPAVAEGLLRSGVETLLAGMFIDDRLRDYAGESLISSAEIIQGDARDRDRINVAGGAARELSATDPEDTRIHPLRGIHALLDIDEITLISVPDAIHRGWSTDARAIDNLLPAPEMRTLVFSAAGGGKLCATWTRVTGATGYRLQMGTDAGFAAPSAFDVDDDSPPSDGDASLCVSRPKGCQTIFYARVQTLRTAEPSPWSNTLSAKTGGQFVECTTLETDAQLQLGIEGGDVPVLRWHATEGAPVLFNVESAYDALFLTSRHDSLTADSQLPLPQAGEGTSYWRVRSQTADESTVGPWSNTVVFTPPSLSQPILDPVRFSNGRVLFDDSLLLSIHRGLLRFCHARGDLLGILSLPRHYGPLDVDDYLAALTPDESAPAGGRPSITGDRPLTIAEGVVLSYGSLFYPWLAHRVDSDRGVSEPVFIPSDGVAAGNLARISIERGAWIAAANRVLTGVIATDPRLADQAIDDLTDLQVNVVTRAAPGFVFIDDRTLSLDSDTRSVSVRRLLILIKRLALREGAALVFEPHDVDLQERVFTEFERVLTTLHQRGAFEGTDPEEAFRVVVDASNNTEETIDAGQLIIELHVAPSQPLKFMRVRLVQNGPQDVSVGEQ
jgi:hypothetical protein